VRQIASVSGLLILFLFTSTSACAQQKVLPVNDDVKEIYDLTYFEGEDKDSAKHKLNLFIPKSDGPHPVLLWIHGGAWAVGGRSQETGVARNFAANGIAVAAMSYRLSPGIWINPKLDTGISHPEHIRDVARAMKWLKTNAKNYGLDGEKLIPGGYSAGGHLSALLVMDETYLKEVDMDFDDVYAALPVAGGYDLIDYYHDMVDEGGEEFAHQHVHAALGKNFEELKAASPTTYLAQSRIPMLVVSETDTYGYTKILEDAVVDAQMEHIKFLHVTDKNHNELFFDMSGDPTSQNVIKMVNFLKAL
jgi:acetyl esterase/lipase